MRLKKVKLLGFKSFAEKTELVFHHGITAIVGPNGCGKSNISDAFRWVLGEQSAKSLRGGKMQDVLFAGTSKRKPLNLAEVTLTFSDVSGKLPTEYDEIEVTRRLLRSGESEYLLNKRSVRLKDVQDLFLDSGVGKASFSIFEQGKIEQIINLNPLERRYIFEEAAGILRFLKRKKEALKRLEKTEYNLSRVLDIYKEVERQIQVLERQAKKALSYKDDKVKLEIFEVALFQLRWGALAEQVNKLGSLEKEKEMSVEKVNESLTQLEGEKRDALSFLEEVRRKAIDEREKIFKTRSAIDIKEKEVDTNKTRVEELVCKCGNLKEELIDVVLQRQTRQKERVQTIINMRLVEKEIFDFAAIRQNQKEKVSGIDQEVANLRENLQKAQKDHLELLQRENQIEGELKHITLLNEHNEDKSRSVSDKVLKEKQKTEKVQTEIEMLKLEIEASNNSLREKKDELLEFENQARNLSVSILETQKKLDSLYQSKARCKARQDALLRLRDEMEGFSRGTKKLLLETSKENSPLFGKLKVLYESIVAERGKELALSVVMRPYTQTLTVKSKQDFSDVLNFAKENEILNFSLLCMEDLPHYPEQMNQGALESFIKFVSDNIFSKTFFKNVFISQTLEQAFQVMNEEKKGVSIWTEDGFFIDPNKVVFYTSEGEKNVFLREAELKTLKEKLKNLELTRLQYEEELKKFIKERGAVNLKKESLEDGLKSLEFELLEKNYDLKRLEDDLEKTSSNILEEEQEIIALDQKIDQQKIQLKSLQNDHAICKRQVIHERELVDSISLNLEEKINYLKEQSASLSEKNAFHNSKIEEFKKFNHGLKLLEIQDVESFKQERRVREEIKNIELQRENLIKNIDLFNQEIGEIEKVLLSVEEASSEFEKIVQKRKESIEEIEERLEEKRKEQKRKESEYYEIGKEIAGLNSTKLSLEAEFLEHNQISIEEAIEKQVDLDEPLEKLEKKIRSLRRRVFDASDINMTSIEEFDKYKERYDFLNKQIDDLEVSKKDLVEIISHLDSESRKIFKDTFLKVKENFKNNFQILFKGGEADLQLTESSDILEAGIEIVAKPPGKKLRSINLLSGGEKCLTAMALLFAIFEIKPAPFCILDEIDAPLDDANIDRFLNVVKKFTDRCQFIIITHNKRTMSIADILIGVSMQEKGVTSLLSLEFSEEKEPEVTLV